MSSSDLNALNQYGKGKYLHWEDNHFQRSKSKQRASAFTAASEIEQNCGNKREALAAIRYISDRYDKKTSFITKTFSIKRIFISEKTRNEIVETRNNFIDLIKKVQKDLKEAKDGDQGLPVPDNLDDFDSYLLKLREIRNMKADGHEPTANDKAELLRYYYMSDERINNIPEWWMERNKLNNPDGDLLLGNEVVVATFGDFIKSLESRDFKAIDFTDKQGIKYKKNEIKAIMAPILKDLE